MGFLSTVPGADEPALDNMLQVTEATMSLGVVPCKSKKKTVMMQLTGWERKHASGQQKFQEVLLCVEHICTNVCNNMTEVIQELHLQVQVYLHCTNDLIDLVSCSDFHPSAKSATCLAGSTFL